MSIITLERVIRADPDAVWEASLSVELHLESMAAHGERALSAPASGTFAEGDEVTWEARHFGIRFRMTSRVYDVDRPRRFCDRQVRGPFALFQHEHLFAPHPDGTLMSDVITMRSPFGPIGWVVDRLVMSRYLRVLISRRNDTLAAACEQRHPLS